MGLDDAMEECAADEAKFTVDGCSGSSSVCPGLGIVVRKRGIGMLEEGDGNFGLSVSLSTQFFGKRLTKPVVYPEIRDEVPNKQI